MDEPRTNLATRRTALRARRGRKRLAALPRPRLVHAACVPILAFVLAFPPDAHAQIVPAPTQNALAGSRVFGSKGCVRCHSVNGYGGEVGPDLARIPEARSFYDLAADMWNHLPQMSATMEQLNIGRPRLDPDEAADLIAFLYTLDFFDVPGNPATGRQLFIEKGCVVCHQVGDLGGVVGPSLDDPGRYATPIQVAAAMWNHGTQMTDALRARGMTRPTFTGTELRDLVAFIRATRSGPSDGGLHVLPGRPEVGQVLFVEKGCITCHSVAGRGGAIGPDLSQRARHTSLLAFAAAMWNKQPSMAVAMRAHGIEVPNVTADEMADLVAYLYSTSYLPEIGSAARGRALLQRKGCMECHVMSEPGPGKAPAFSDTRAGRSAAAVIAALWNHLPLIGTVPSAEWPDMSSTEIADLTAFLRAAGADSR